MVLDGFDNDRVWECDCECGFECCGIIAGVGIDEDDGGDDGDSVDEIGTASC